MPDPLRQTISATQAPALFGVSPYYTRWMMWQHFARGIAIDSPEDARMSWGKKLQPLVLAQTAEDMRFEVRANADDHYHRRGRLGCTRDGTIICPDRGPGAVETKCVFDYRTWMADWQGGKCPPRQHEIQLQQQMFVGDESGPYKWGVLTAWVAGEQHYFEREPIPELLTRLEHQADAFFAEVEAMREPDPFGAVVEIDLLNRLFPTAKGKVVDLSGDPEADAHAEMAAMFNMHKETASAAGAEAEKLRAKILALVKDAEEVLLPGRVKIIMTTTKTGQRRLKVYVPDDMPPPAAPAIPIEQVLYAG